MVVVAVVVGSPAEGAGVKVGDVLEQVPHPWGLGVGRGTRRGCLVKPLFGGQTADLFQGGFVVALIVLVYGHMLGFFSSGSSPLEPFPSR